MLTRSLEQSGFTQKGQNKGAAPSPPPPGPRAHVLRCLSTITDRIVGSLWFSHGPTASKAMAHKCQPSAPRAPPEDDTETNGKPRGVATPSTPPARTGVPGASAPPPEPL